MVVCSYFLNGRCRFGERCRYEHPSQNGSFSSNQSGNYFASSNYQGQRGSNNNRYSNKDRGTPTAQDIVDTVIMEMNVWDSSGMWSFSCFGYHKESPCLPGFEDISPEELRWDAYEKQKSNTFTEHQQKVAQLASEYKMKRSGLKKPDAQMKQKMFQEIINLEKRKASQTSSTSVSPANNSVFDSSSNENKQGFQSFGSVLNQAGGSGNQGFGSAGSVFGGSNSSSTSAFGSNVSSQNRFAAFNSSSTPQPTGGSTSSALSQFSFTAPKTQQGFGASQQPQTQQVFGNTQFQNQTNPPSGNTFGQAAGLFGKPSPSNSTQPFGNSQAFGNMQPVGNSQAFGNTQAFGNNLTNTKNTNVAAQKSNTYSDMSSLTQEQKEQFECEKFTLGKIPMVPPPIEMI